LEFIQRQTELHTITIDEEVHNELRNMLSEDERQCSFRNAAILLYDAWTHESFENMWWDCPLLGSCHRYVPHVLNLRDYFFTEAMRSGPWPLGRITSFKPPPAFCDLLAIYQGCVFVLTKSPCL
jgi:hypothetical protein